MMNEPSSWGRILIGLGILCILVGIILIALERFVHLGRLPGDIFVRGEHGSFYFPIVSCILISIILSVILNLFHH